jgi:hypothetical protein
MFMKLFLTALVIAGAVIAIRIRKRPPARRAPAVNPPMDPASGSTLPRMMAYATVITMLVGSGVYFYFQWKDAYQVVSVRIIDTRSGKEVVYQAYKGDIDGRSFETTDGRIVTLAEVERLELGDRVP